MTTRLTPWSSPSRTSATVRSPPPSWTRTAPPGVRDDAADERQVLAVAERPVQVHDVNPGRALLGEALGDRDGILPINGLPRRLALAEANDAAVSNVDGGIEVHYRSATGATGSWVSVEGCCAMERGALRAEELQQAVALAHEVRRAGRRAIGAPLPSSTRRESLATPLTRNS